LAKISKRLIPPKKGVECLTLIVRKDCGQLLAWTDPTNGTSGLENVLTLIARMLSPQEKESGGLFMGDLIIHLLRKAGDAVVPVLPGLLQALVNRITSADSATFLQVRMTLLSCSGPELTFCFPPLAKLEFDHSVCISDSYTARNSIELARRYDNIDQPTPKWLGSTRESLVRECRNFDWILADPCQVFCFCHSSTINVRRELCSTAR
jgi:hypothetical protein